MEKRTATEILLEEKVIDCYLCGKGKIKMPVGEIIAQRMHPMDHRVRMALQDYLRKAAERFFLELKP